jgi:hypothetical protein
MAQQLGRLDDWEPLPRPMTRAILDGQGCSDPDCQCKSKAGTYPIYWQQVCHPGAGHDVFYFDGVMTLRCHECMENVAQFEVK